ncbi:hypothetical protein BIW11_05885 [Tropilaelaps mercedesae]|uniref:Uncharacterized protein n=1 Tax=Tropilaelaps mercedesae TaxID=418985 RepID=A0A1V9Y0F7_9ACAR|nr:hypothetical protein BIW11_05885 [Tropilaelaps mercedesae]
MFRKTLVSDRRSDTRAAHLGGDLAGSTFINSPIISAISATNKSSIYSNTIDNGKAGNTYSTVVAAQVTSKTGEDFPQECAIPTGGVKSGPLPEAPLDLLAEIQRELPVCFRSHSSGRHNGLARQNSEKFRDTDSIRFMKQNRLSWWYSPVGSSSAEYHNLIMADGSPDPLHRASQDIYEVVEENFTVRDRTTSKEHEDQITDDQTSSQSKSDGVKKPHDYEVIPEDFFLKQRAIRDGGFITVAAHRTTPASISSASSTNPFFVSTSSRNSIGEMSIAHDVDFFLPVLDSFPEPVQQVCFIHSVRARSVVQKLK